ncbi:MAG TPA: dienelactone hydrolase, partial [Gammaproteobacteria bacterium]|nr:dienelactone hydrolase [Gammaproteobacteria bacterium]
MHLKHPFSIFLASLLACSSATADTASGGNYWWWDDAWWDEGLLEVPDNYAIETSWTSYHSGDVEVPALVARPEGKGKYPAVLFQHGRRGLD